jgi:tRNA threonylcarbamoyladenosine biosynthesis protein TsaE
MAILTSSNPEETAAIGEALGRQAQVGWMIGLSGDLGAGKTQFVKGVARGLGCPARVHSPTFALIHEYSGGRLRLYHLDLYRLDGPAQVMGAGLEEYLFNPNGVAVVEWIERWLPNSAAPPNIPNLHRVRIEVVDENTRKISHESPGL